MTRMALRHTCGTYVLAMVMNVSRPCSRLKQVKGLELAVGAGPVVLCSEVPSGKRKGTRRRSASLQYLCVQLVERAHRLRGVLLELLADGLLLQQRRDLQRCETVAPHIDVLAELGVL
jgi:hypothetical protein